MYSTNDWKFKRAPFFEAIRVGIPKALARFCVLAVWTCNVHLMMSKGEMHLAIVSFGSTLVGTFIFITEGMSQATITIAARLIGARKWTEMWKLYRSTLLFSLGTILFLSVPLLVFPKLLVIFFFKSPASSLPFSLFQKTCVWVWLLFISNAVNYIGVSFLAASKDTTFHMCANMLSWIVCYLPIRMGIGMWNWRVDRFWIVLAAEPLIIASILHLRMRKEKWKQMQTDLKTLRVAN